MARWVYGCRFCGEPEENHRILRQVIKVTEWHRVWSAEGRMLKPSDASSIVYPSDYHKGGPDVKVPEQRKPTARTSLTAQRL